MLLHYGKTYYIRMFICGDNYDRNTKNSFVKKIKCLKCTLIAKTDFYVTFLYLSN